jgi:hypothetical protein
MSKDTDGVCMGFTSTQSKSEIVLKPCPVICLYARRLPLNLTNVAAITFRVNPGNNAFPRFLWRTARIFQKLWEIPYSTCAQHHAHALFRLYIKAYEKFRPSLEVLDYYLLDLCTGERLGCVLSPILRSSD